MMKIMSNRDKIVVWKSMLSTALFMSSYLPNVGLAAASTEVRVLRTVVMPALAIEIVCCSIASWIATRSSGRILSNSSMHTTPPSASTIAPPSRKNSPVFGSLTTVAVRPAAEEPLPDVYTEIGAAFSMNLRSWDLAVEGSPSIRMLMSPRRRAPSGSCFREPPISWQQRAFLMSSCPKMEGAMERCIFAKKSGSDAIWLNLPSSSAVKSVSVIRPPTPVASEMPTTRR
mmetsp:Transcript_19716/g.45707  ORF Transcript_19716/g.45707 Transcript_19716/m.45707 type:complete len:229 (-) Transcript_19716:926-1612(-)